MSDDFAARHLTDEELLLDYYGEASPEQRAGMRGHLASCDACQALDRELRGVLALVDTEPVPDAPEGFEHEMWARLEPQLRSRAAAGVSRPAAGSGAGWSSWRLEFPRWALAASAAALALASFTLGRAWGPPPAPARESPADARALSERLLRSEVEEHLERSQRVLVELANLDESAPVVLASDRAQAADLVAAGRLYRRTAEEIGDADTRDLLEDIERVLVEVANGPADEPSNDLSDVRARISNKDLIFRLRVVTAELRARERRARTTW